MDIIAQKGMFRRNVERLIAQVPSGFVTTYGDIAAIAGCPAAARVVGGVAHFGDMALPWHRLVNRKGGLASGFHGGRSRQAELLAIEGVECTNYFVENFESRRWQFNR